MHILKKKHSRQSSLNSVASGQRLAPTTSAPLQQNTQNLLPASTTTPTQNQRASSQGPVPMADVLNPARTGFDISRNRTPLHIETAIEPEVYGIDEANSLQFTPAASSAVPLSAGVPSSTGSLRTTASGILATTNSNLLSAETALNTSSSPRMSRFLEEFSLDNDELEQPLFFSWDVTDPKEWTMERVEFWLKYNMFHETWVKFFHKYNINGIQFVKLLAHDNFKRYSKILPEKPFSTFDRFNRLLKKTMENGSQANQQHNPLHGRASSDYLNSFLTQPSELENAPKSAPATQMRRSMFIPSSSGVSQQPLLQRPISLMEPDPSPTSPSLQSPSYSIFRRQHKPSNSESSILGRFSSNNQPSVDDKRKSVASLTSSKEDAKKLWTKLRKRSSGSGTAIDLTSSRVSSSPERVSASPEYFLDEKYHPVAGSSVGTHILVTRDNRNFVPLNISTMKDGAELKNKILSTVGIQHQNVSFHLTGFGCEIGMALPDKVMDDLVKENSFSFNKFYIKDLSRTFSNEDLSTIHTESSNFSYENANTKGGVYPPTPSYLYNTEPVKPMEEVDYWNFKDRSDFKVIMKDEDKEIDFNNRRESPYTLAPKREAPKAPRRRSLVKKRHPLNSDVHPYTPGSTNIMVPQPYKGVLSRSPGLHRSSSTLSLANSIVPSPPRLQKRTSSRRIVSSAAAADNFTENPISFANAPQLSDSDNSDGEIIWNTSKKDTSIDDSSDDGIIWGDSKTATVSNSALDDDLESSDDGIIWGNPKAKAKSQKSADDDSSDDGIIWGTKIDRTEDTIAPKETSSSTLLTPKPALMGLRPTAEVVLQNLERFFPDADLDKPIEETTPVVTAVATRVLRRTRTIRSIAREATRRLQPLMRRQSTKMWGHKTFEVKEITKINSSKDSQGSYKEFAWIKGEIIGKGTFGTVYLALNVTTGDMIAVKQVADAPKDVVDALQSEVITLQNLDHLNIVQYLGFEKKNNTYSLFLEYVDGGSVGSCIRMYGKFEETCIRFLTVQILKGLAYLHQKGILHRDMKADNLLLDSSGCCKISDFGISKTSSDIYMNSEMTMRGTVFWMAPEMVDTTRGYSAKVDIWSLGCVVLEMFAGKRPWSNLEVVAAMFKIGQKKSAPPIPDDIDISAQGREFLNRCFEIDPERRPTAAELLSHSFCKTDPSFDFKKTDLAKAIKFNDKQNSSKLRAASTEL